MTELQSSSGTKSIYWRDDAGVVHVRDDVPADAVCLVVGQRCPVNDADRGHVGTVLAIGSSTFVCCSVVAADATSAVEHPLPSRIVVLTEGCRDYRVIDASTEPDVEMYHPMRSPRTRTCSTCGRAGPVVD